MRLLLVIVACLLARPAFAGDGIHWEPPDRYEWAAFVAADALVWVDVLQSRSIREHELRVERNPILVSIMSDRPSKGQFFWVSGVGATGLMAIGFVALPRRVRFLLPIAVGVAELFMIRNNYQNGLTFSF